MVGFFLNILVLNIVDILSTTASPPASLVNNQRQS